MNRLLTLCVSVLLSGGGLVRAGALPSLAEALQARRDLWGEAAMAQPDGPGYEFFVPLLPPPRYVNADFRYYPIVLSAPNAPVKARLISNGSGLNLRGGARAWRDVGTPVRFRVGPDRFLFGSLPERLSEPELAEGWLPIVEIRYTHRSPFQSEGRVPLDQHKVELPPEVYRLEAFAATEPALAARGVVFVKFDLAGGTNGFIAAEFDCVPALGLANGRLTNADGETLAFCDGNWRLEGRLLTARLTPGRVATLAVLTAPVRAGLEAEQDAFAGLSAPEAWARHRTAAVETWRGLLARGMRVETPEPVVNRAWRHLICQTFALINGDRMHYSAGNQYERLYEAEGSEAMLALLWWGFQEDARGLIPPLLAFTRPGLEIHQAGFKLLDVCHYYWQSRDAAALAQWRPHWLREARRLLEGRTEPNGLFPMEQYCGDIHTPVYSLNANAKAWRALRDLGAVLAETGEPVLAQQCAADAAAFRRTILDAVARSVRRETTPPFVPVALFGQEAPHDPILHSRIGSYWNIVIGYTLGSGIFPPGSESESWIADYQEQHGGLFMGMLRSGGGGEFNFWTGEHRVNPLYGTRYVLDVLRRDKPERALVSFYGMLAQGFTRNTFISGEGCSLEPLDLRGRMFYLPPNSAANAHFLTMLRHLLVQDWDLNDDGKPETLRLAFATPRRWLKDGGRIVVEDAPTAFGRTSFRMSSRLGEGRVEAEFELPTRHPPERVLARVRLPSGWRIREARLNDRAVSVDEAGTVELTGCGTRARLVVEVSR